MIASNSENLYQYFDTANRMKFEVMSHFVRQNDAKKGKKKVEFEFPLLIYVLYFTVHGNSQPKKVIFVLSK